MTRLTKAQRARLDKLATYLERLPADYSHFDMAIYSSLSNEADVEYSRKNGGLAKYDCGAVACALGHGPAAGILVPPRFVGRYVRWLLYGRLFTGNIAGLWSWLFDENWAYVDNHHFGAAARIRCLLDHDEPPPVMLYSDEAVALYAPYRIDAAPSPTPTQPPAEIVAPRGRGM